MALVDKQTIELKRRNSYIDFLTNFDLNPVTKNLATVSDEQSVKQSITNLILTGTGERFYHADKGSRVPHSLFEPNTPETIDMIEQLTRETIDAYEPRATVHQIRINETLDNNTYAMTIVFSIINIPDVQELVLSLNRVR